MIQYRTGVWKCLRSLTPAAVLDQVSRPMGARFLSPVLGWGLARSSRERHSFRYQHSIKVGLPNRYYYRQAVHHFEKECGFDLLSCLRGCWQPGVLDMPVSFYIANMLALTSLISPRDSLIKQPPQPGFCVEIWQKPCICRIRHFGVPFAMYGNHSGGKENNKHNNFAGLSWKWVGVKLFMCFPLPGEKGNTKTKFPGNLRKGRDSPGTIP